MENNPYKPYVREDGLLGLKASGVTYGLYSRAQEQSPGNFVLSGKTATDPETKLIVSEDVGLQFDFLLEDIRLALESLGLTPKALTRMRIYTLNPSGDLDSFKNLAGPSNTSYNKFAEEHGLQVARTNIGVSTLPSPDHPIKSLVEIEATFYVPEDIRKNIIEKYK